MAAGGLGRFELRKEIGRGGMSTVWEARDRLSKTAVAIKLFRFPEGMAGGQQGEMLERCRREVEAASRISHSNVAKVYEAGEAEEGFYIVMEYVRGVSVRERLRMEGRFEPGSAGGIGLQLCEALGAAHALGIVHCDLKPENILLEGAGALREKVKLGSWGVAQAARRAGEMVGAWGGSPGYMSPEQVMGKVVDGRSDIFSLGVVLFEMLTGRAAFEGDSIVAVVHRVVNEPLEVGDLPLPFRGIVGKATEKRASLRYGSALEMREALREALGT